VSQTISHKSKSNLRVRRQSGDRTRPGAAPVATEASPPPRTARASGGESAPRADGNGPDEKASCRAKTSSRHGSAGVKPGRGASPRPGRRSDRDDVGTKPEVLTAEPDGTN